MHPRPALSLIILDVTHPDANKGFVAGYLSRLLGIPEEEIATIGDQPNDVLMFKRSGFSIAMGNASEEVRRQASAVTDSNRRRGRSPKRSSASCSKRLISSVEDRTGGMSMKSAAWKALEDHQKKMREVRLRDLFADDPGRGQRMTAEAAGVFLDYSKNRITDETLKLLIDLAEQSGLRARIDAMFRGEKINVTEGRAALHVALRAPQGKSILVDGQNVVPEVHAVLDKMADFSRRVRDGALERSLRQAHQECCQYRHRRLRSWTRHGL